MCGICGLVAPAEQDEKLIQKVVNTLSHRGPDGQAYRSLGQGIWLGHARLKVIDLSPEAAQPMATDQHVIVFNGEIYNHRELRRELEDQGETFFSQSDTEVLLRAFSRHGDAILPKLHGMFAFAIWDGTRLFLARDFSGKKPLYFFHSGKKFIFASEPKAICAALQVQAVVNCQAYGLVFGAPPAEKSWYQEIRQIPPGGSAWLDPATGELIQKRWWTFPKPTRTPPLQPARKIRDLLLQAVERRLQSDVPLGAFLSGGIDSTVVVGLIRELRPHARIRTFSVRFVDDPKYDESSYALLAARKFRTDHEILEVKVADLQDPAGMVLRQHDGPFGDSSTLPFHLLCREAKKHVTVALTGDGGDEVFGGYDRMRACLWNRWTPRWFSRLTGIMPSVHPKSFLARLRRFLRASATSLPESLWSLTAFFQPEEIGKRWSNLDPSLQARWKESEGWPLENRILHLNFSQYLAEDLLPKGDRASMAVGLEIRCPFLDRDLANFSLSLPGNHHFDLFRSKKILKKACADLIPEEILCRPKMGFGIPLAEIAPLPQSPEKARFLEPLPWLTQAMAQLDSTEKKWLVGLWFRWLGSLHSV